MLREADRHLERVIYRAIQGAKLAGQDGMFQNDVAARTVRWIRPGMTVSNGRGIRSVQTSAKRLRTAPERSCQYQKRMPEDIVRCSGRAASVSIERDLPF